jgi:hypothetical protein
MGEYIVADLADGGVNDLADRRGVGDLVDGGVDEQWRCIHAPVEQQS